MNLAEYMRTHPTAPGAVRWALSTAAARAVEVFRAEGLGSLWFKSLGEACYRRLYVLERDVGLALPTVSGAVPVTVEVLAETAEYRSFRTDRPPDEAKQLIDAGGRCYIARHEGEIVSATWAFRERAPLPYLRTELVGGPETVALYDSWTLPSFRGFGISPVIGLAILRDAHRDGYRRVLTAVLPENRQSLAARAKLGFRIVEVRGCIRLGPFDYHFHRPVWAA